MILIIFVAILAFLLWFYWEISRNDMMKDVSGGHEVPLIKPGLDLAYSSNGTKNHRSQLSNNDDLYQRCKVQFN